MKILFTIPHYYNPESGGRYGSTRNNPAQRIKALKRCISSIHSLFGEKQFNLDIASHSAIPVNDLQKNEIDIAVVTVKDKYLLKDLNINPELYTHREVITDSMMLGFECKKVLAQNFSKYDYYCYLEYDLIINDPWFFTKLKWFNKLTNDGYLLQPNRFEVSTGNIADKVYVDGNLRIQATEKFQDITDSQILTGIVMEEKILFKRALNPHSGCYFLNQNQLKNWMEQSYFEENDISFIGPLESAATLGIMKTFKVYKPEPHSFLEILHSGTSFLNLVGNKVKIAKEQVIR